MQEDEPIPLETATYVNSLINLWPEGTDQRSTADDHFRLLKATILRTWPNIAGQVVATDAEHNFLQSLSVNIQATFNRLFLGGASDTASGTVFYARNAGMLGSLSMSEYARTSVSETFHRAVVFEEQVTLRAGIGGGLVNLGTLSGTVNIDPVLGNYFCAVLAGNVPSISIGPAISAGQVLSIRFQQDGTGSRTVTGWPATVVWADSSAFAARASASAIDFITMIRDPLSLWLAAPRRFG